jgi:hypothetical protein
MTTLARVVMWGLLACFPVAANAQQQEQPQKLEAGMADRAPEAAIQAVNEEAHDPNACSLASIAFVRGIQGKSLPAPGGVMKVTQVTILATQTPAGWQRTPPILQFTAIFEKLEEA